VIDDTPHLPYAAPIEAYGNGGFRFAGGLSHRGALLCLPDGIWASSATSVETIDAAALAPVFARAGTVRHCIVGTGERSAFLSPPLMARFRAASIALETMTTRAAVRTYNVLVGEARPVAALLIPIA